MFIVLPLFLHEITNECFYWQIEGLSPVLSALGLYQSLYAISTSFAGGKYLPCLKVVGGVIYFNFILDPGHGIKTLMIGMI